MTAPVHTPAPPSGGARRRRWALVAVVVLAAAAVGGLFAWRVAQPLPKGPVDVEATDRVSFPFKAGVAGSLGFITLLNPGDQTAVLESVRPVGVDRGLIVERIFAAGDTRSMGGYCCTAMWPPSKEVAKVAFPMSDLRPVRGTLVRPDRSTPSNRAYGAAIVLIVRADRPGDFAFRGLEVTYRIGDREYRRVVTNAFTMCVSPDGRRRCEAKPGYSSAEADRR